MPSDHITQTELPADTAEAPRARQPHRPPSLPPVASLTSANVLTLAEAERVRLAADQAAPAAALQLLANDPAVTVRATVAMNHSAGSSLFSVVAGDPDERVRALLGRRLALLLPTLSADDRSQLRDHAVATLMTLVADQADRVRGAIADVVKDMPGAPHELILRLAQDLAITVAEPVIRLSPALTDQDLLNLVAAPAGPATVTAVARRPGIGSRIAQAIADGDNEEAITALLSNRSAAISETTLDRLIGRAAQHMDWHAPLVRRPRLSASAVTALADIVTGAVLGELAQRADLPTDIAASLARRLGAALAPVPTQASTLDAPTLDQALSQAHLLAKQGQLSEDSLIAAARRGEARLVTGMLATAAGVAVEVVDRAARLRSAKGLISLVWRAGFTMRAAGPLQPLLARLPPDQVITPGEHGEFPLSAEEMRWQVEFLMRMGNDTGAFP